MWLCWRPLWCTQSTSSHKCNQPLLLLKLPRLPETSPLPEHILSPPIRSFIRSLVIGSARDDPGRVLGVGDTEKEREGHSLGTPAALWQPPRQGLSLFLCPLVPANTKLGSQVRRPLYGSMWWEMSTMPYAPFMFSQIPLSPQGISYLSSLT